MKIDSCWSQAAENYNRIVRDELKSFRVKAWLDIIHAHTPESTGLEVLDLGCGPGFFSLILCGAGHRVTGADGMEAMLACARENARHCAAQPTFVQADCHTLPFAAHSFDLLISRNVTHTLHDHAEAYREWRRVLRPGGLLLVFDANWHLMQTDAAIHAQFAAREEACISRYGTNFSAGGQREAAAQAHPGAHRLGLAQRPQWDVPLLQAAGFSSVTTHEDIIDTIWDDKETLLYGATPMFLIAAQ